ncbi:hypothetical protein BJX61DRAFT_160186 [Aspergillus egyptiacus]|nr:hypothetical protein BJX61DRAFT_160186 [Aspergillus egyptiacus]
MIINLSNSLFSTATLKLLYQSVSLAVTVHPLLFFADSVSSVPLISNTSQSHHHHHWKQNPGNVVHGSGPSPFICWQGESHGCNESI